MEIHGSGRTAAKASSARFAIMQFSLKDEHKVAGYDEFRRVFNEDPGDRTERDCDALRPLLETISAFRVLVGERDAMLRLCRALRLVTIPWAGVELMREGERGDCMYFVLAGRFHLTALDERGARRDLGAKGPGDVVGETALRAGEGGERTATVTSVEAAELLRVEKADYDDLLRARDRDDDHGRRERRRVFPPWLGPVQVYFKGLHVREIGV